MKIDRQLFRTNIPLIDNQHEEYLKLVDDLFKLCERPHVEQATIDASLKKVLAYAVEHFDAEESLMLSTRYHDYEIHRTKHDEFRDQFDRLSAMSNEAIAPDDQLIQLTKWLVEWFCQQTQVHDRRLAGYLKKQGYKSPDH